MALESAAYLVKPEAIAYRREIRNMIASAGLNVEEYCISRLCPEHVRMIYADLTEPIIKASIAFLCSGQCEIGIVTGKAVFKHLGTVAGQHTDPGQCLPNTIRHRFGYHEAVHYDGVSYFRNAIHRTQDVDELARVMKVYEELISSLAYSGTPSD